MLKCLIRAVLLVGLYSGLTQCHLITIPGRPYSTQLGHVEFSDNWWESRLANPCRIVAIPRDWSPVEDDIPPKDFYEKMIEDIESAQDKLKVVESANPTPLQCPGSLPSLPPTPDLMNLNSDELVKQVYQSGIDLVAHLEIVRLDREIDSGMTITQSEQKGKFLQCGNEYDFYVNSVGGLINSIDDILCRLTTGTSGYQRSKFRNPLNNILKAEIFRDRSACSIIEIRDCIVLQEAHRELNNFRSAFIQLNSESKSQHFYGKGQSMFAPGSNFLK